MAKVEQMPPVDLAAHERDVHLPNEQFLELSLFAPLKNKPNLAKFPGTLVVRRYRKGEVICRQGEAGWTAFYLLTSDDALALCRHRLAAATDGRQRAALVAEVETLGRRVERLRSVPPDSGERTAAMVYLAVAQPPSGKAPPGPGKAAEEKAAFIPIDGPVTLRYDNLQAPLREGDLFGEMSCLYRAPRSATIVATRDCYVVEMLRHILDQLMKDKGYKERADKLYKKRVLELHVRKLSIFEDLTDAQYNEIHDSVELLSVEPGTLVCDEHERSDSLYIVRSGLVKVMKFVSSLVAAGDVEDWAGLCARLRQGDAPAGAAAPPKDLAKLWQLLPAPVQALLRGTDPAAPDDARKAEILYGINDVLRKQELGDAPEFQELAATPAARSFAEHKPAKKKDWMALDVRRFNRLLLEALVPEGVLRRVHKRDGQDCILNYCARGDYFGEMGLILQKPRSATCIAYGHPNDYGLVELVRLPAATVRKLIDESPDLRAKVDREIARRQQYMAERGRNLIDDTREVQKSERFEQLGLIQGQKLMLIDLDRCTRCDECVKACVATHDDGHSRLFLDGPRFGKYLVPTTCRSCLDPVCMITCPVGSIHRGDNRQIVIEDWCIGCQQCAKNCPYGSIQMHDLGILPEGSGDWHLLPAAAAPGDAWLRRGFRDAAWLAGAGPFHLDRELRDQLAARRPRGAAADGPINFRCEFDLPPGLLRKAGQFRLELASLSPSVRVWLNARELTSDDKPRRDGSRAYSLPPPAKEGTPALRAADLLRPGGNVVAVQVAPTAKSVDVLLRVRLDEVRRPELPADVDEKAAAEITQKLVTERAVVCDLCSTLSQKKPACVQACPHDAALRVDARFEFPTR
jgi:CRP-like cAMP-binding protein